MENLTSIKSISDVFTTVPSVLPSLPSLPKDSIIQCQKCGHLKQGTTGMMGLAKSYLSQKCSVCQKDNTYEGVPAAGEKKCWEWGKLNTTTTCCDKEVTEEDLQNCRNCGDVICKQCTVKAEGVPGYTSPGFTVPVCKACYGILDARLIVSLLVTAVSQELGERVVNIIDCLRDNHPKLEAMRLTSKVASGNLPTTCKILLLEEQGGAQLTRIESTSDDFPDKWKDFWTRYSDAAPTPSLDDQCTVCDASPTDCRCRRYFSSEGEVPKNVKVHLQSGAMDRDTVNILNVVTSTLVKSVLKGIPVEVIPQERWKWVCPNCQCESSGKNWHAECEVCLTKSLKVCIPPKYKPAVDALSCMAPWLFPDLSDITDKVSDSVWHVVSNGSFSVCIADQLPLVQNLGTAEDVRELGSALKEFSEAWHLRQHLSKTGHVPYCKKPFACSGLCAMQYLVAVKVQRGPLQWKMPDNPGEAYLVQEDDAVKLSYPRSTRLASDASLVEGVLVSGDNSFPVPASSAADVQAYLDNERDEVAWTTSGGENYHMHNNRVMWHLSERIDVALTGGEVKQVGLDKDDNSISVSSLQHEIKFPDTYFDRIHRFLCDGNVNTSIYD